MKLTACLTASLTCFGCVCRFNQHKDPEHGSVVAGHGPRVCDSTHGAGGLHPSSGGVLQTQAQRTQAPVAPSHVQRNCEFTAQLTNGLHVSGSELPRRLKLATSGAFVTNFYKSLHYIDIAA